jgi:hypothetical protein
MTIDHKADCFTCQHYRTQTSFVEAHKNLLEGRRRRELYEAMNEVRKEEIEILEGEIEMLMEQCRVEDMTWPSIPRFTPLCAAPGGPFVAALKNRGGDCADYLPAFMRAERACHSCSHAKPAETFLGARLIMDPQAYSKERREQTQLHNKETDDADAAAMAMEIRQAFSSDGRMSSPSFVRTCGVRVEGGRSIVIPTANLRQDCDVYRPLFAIPQVLLDAVRREKAAPFDSIAFGFTLRLIRGVLQASDPEAFVGFAMSLMGGEPQSAAVGRWGVFCGAKRFKEVFKDAAIPEMGDYEPFAPGALMPAIVGCDAFEWAVLAAISHQSELASLVATSICQQVAEFTTGTLSPIARRNGFEAVTRLLAVPQLFSSETLMRAEPFVQRLSAQAQMLDLAATTDLRIYFEDFLGQLSYPVASYLRMEPEKVMMPGAPQAQRAARLRASERKRYGERRAAEILGGVVAILAKRGIAHHGERTAFLRALIEENENAVRDDLQSINQVANSVGPEMGIVPEAGWVDAVLQPIRQIVNQQQESEALALLIKPRILIASLVLTRGAAPVTPCASVLWGREPTPGQPPRDDREALHEPAGLTIEAWHARRLGQAAPEIADYLCGVRSIAAPTFYGAR